MKLIEAIEQIEKTLDTLQPQEARNILTWLIGSRLLPILEAESLPFFANLFTEENLALAKQRR